MSYPYGAPGGGYPQQGQGGYPQQGGYPGMPQPGGGMPQPGGAGGFVQPGMPQPGCGMPQPGGGMPQPGGGMPQPGGGYPQQYPQQGYPQQPMGMPTADSASGAYGAGQPGGLPYSMNPPATGFGGAGGPPAPGYGQLYGQPGGAMPSGGYAPQAQQPGYPTGQPQSASYNTPKPATAPYNPQQQQQQQPPQQQQHQQQPQGQVQGSGGQVSANYSSSGSAATGYKQPCDPTVKPYPGFNPEEDSKKLRKAMKGLGTDEKAIIDILGYRSNGQRQQIKVMYKTMFGRDLIVDLKSELGGNFENVIVAAMMTPEEYDAYELKRAMRGVGTDESALIEILCTRNNSRLKEIIQTYKCMYGKNLEKEIASETSGHFRKLLISMVAGGRMEDQQVSVNKAAQDAQALYQAGEKRLGTDESVFNSIIASQSYEQLRAVFDNYAKITGHDITQAVAREFSGDVEKGLLTIINCVRSRTMYFADRLYYSMKGLGTDDETLIRVVVSRSEVDMVQIKQEFQKKYKQTLEQFIKSDVSGDYRRFLLALVGGM